MYQIFKRCIADHQGSGVDSWYFVIEFGTYDEAYSNWLALRETVKNDSWTEYELKADHRSIGDLQAEVQDCNNYIEELNERYD